MRFGNRSSSPNEAPLVIAEIGINHGGNLGVTKIWLIWLQAQVARV